MLEWAAMKLVFALGPIETDEGNEYAVTVADERAPTDVVLGPTLEAALGELVERHGRDELELGPELSAAARALELPITAHTEVCAWMRASQAFVLINAQTVAEAELAGPIGLLSALRDYCEAAPWRWLSSDIPVRVSVRRRKGPARRFEVSVLGNARELIGLALHDPNSSITRMAGPAPEVDRVVLLTLDDGPAWAVEAMAGIGVPYCPTLTRVRRGEMGPLAGGDVDRIEATVVALTQLGPDEPQVELVSEGDGDRVVVRASLAPVEPSAPVREVRGRRAKRKKPGRNARCPCGSGKKYKRCCLDKDEAEEARALALETPPGNVVEQLHAFMEHELPDHEPSWLERLFGSRQRPLEFGNIVVPLILFDLAIEQGGAGEGETVVERFLASDYGRALGQEPRSELECSASAYPSIWEVLGVEPGRGVAVTDLLTGKRCFVHEVAATRSLKPRASVLARVAWTGDGRRVFDGLHPYQLPPKSADEVVAGVRRELRIRRLWVRPSELETPAAALTVFEQWHERAVRHHEEPRLPVTLVNTDGDAIELVYDQFRVHDVAAQIAASLRELPGALDDGVDDEGGLATTLTRAGNAMFPGWSRTSVACCRVAGDTLTIETNSKARADAARELVEAQLGLLARFHERRVEAVEAPRKPGGGQVAIDTQALSGWFEPTPELLDALELRRWRHQPNDALDGQTPSEAARRAASRRRLHALLREREFGAPPSKRRAYLELREELGIDPLGERRPKAMLPKTEISSRLLEFCAPALMIAAEHEAEAILRAGAEVWNFAAEVGAIDEPRPPALVKRARASLREHGLEVPGERLRAWIEQLLSGRALYDEDPRLVELIALELTDEGFNLRAAALLPDSWTG